MGNDAAAVEKRDDTTGASRADGDVVIVIGCETAQGAGHENVLICCLEVLIMYL